MKKTPIALLFAGAATAVALLSAPVYAATTAVGDSDLEAIAGKLGENTFAVGSSSGTTTSIASLGADNSANIQFVWYQWTDNHAGDLSNHKGANDVQGNDSTVMQSVTSEANALFWGGLGQNRLENTDSAVNNDQSNMAYGSFGNGGF